MQHLSNWTTVGDMTSLNALDLVVRLSSRCAMHFQRVPFHIRLYVNEIADCLPKSVTADTLQGYSCLTFTEISSIKRMGLNALWRVPPAHSWYFGEKRFHWWYQLNIPRNQQTVLSHFFSDHIKPFTFQQGRKVGRSSIGARLIRTFPVVFLIA
ncbi:autophagy protein 5 [Trichonephila clavipes]|uniref:Autophagy protein 5 n=1 Tax=Trichonephila clavipes TaxID=2585209 RepID=A0A8X6VKB9_TRICX|nr:autophagy protein 5 [Trichonephila clavipes]